MKKITLLLFLLFPFFSIQAQSEVDSLKNVLETQNMNSEERLNTYKQLCRILILSDLKEGVKYANTALEFAKEEKNNLMNSFFYNILGICYNRFDNIDSTKMYYDLALNYAIECKNVKDEAAIYSNISVMHGKLGNYNDAIFYLLKSLSIYENIEDKLGCGRILSNIGSIHRMLKNFDKSIEYLNKGKEILEELNNSYGMMTTYYDLGCIYKEQKEFDEALSYGLKSTVISDSLNDIQYQVLTKILLSEVYSAGFQDYKKAEKCNDDFLMIAEKTKEDGLMVKALNMLSANYFTQHRFQESKDAALKVLELDSITPIVRMNATAYLTRSNIQLGNKEEADYYYVKNREYSDNNFEKEFAEGISEMETKYETEKKEMRIVALEEKEKLYIWLGIAGFLFSIALGIMLWLRIRSARKEKQLIATRSVLDGEMGERSRLARDLHDRLSGNLSALKMGIKDNRESILSIQNKLDNCIDEIRRIAHNLMPASLQFGLKVALGDFAAQFQNVQFHFFGEEKRAEDRIEFVVYCCASELVNNSIRHSGATNINLQLIQSEKYISITVQDDGCGFDENSIKKGFGMKSIYDRITSCNGKIDVSSSPGNGTETTIELKIES